MVNEDDTVYGIGRSTYFDGPIIKFLSPLHSLKPNRYSLYVHCLPSNYQDDVSCLFWFICEDDVNKIINTIPYSDVDRWTKQTNMEPQNVYMGEVSLLKVIVTHFLVYKTFINSWFKDKEFSFLPLTHLTCFTNNCKW